MSWKDFGWIMLLITLGNVVAFLWSEEAELWFFGVLAVGVLVTVWGGMWLWRRRLERLRDADDGVLAERLGDMSDDDRAAVRLALGLVTSDDAVVDTVEGDRFEMPSTPRSLRAAMTWGGIGMAGLVVLLEVTGHTPADSPTTTLLIAGFFLAAAIFFDQLPRWEGGTLLVTHSGLVQLGPLGRRVGILWSEVAQIRNHPFLMCVDVRSSDGQRRIRIPHTLDGFSRLMELVVAHLHWIDERVRGAGRPDHPNPDGEGDDGG